MPLPITNTALKLMPKIANLFLTSIINGCLRIGYFPTVWKNAIILTIPKPGKNHSLPINYRPISLLSSLSKIFEKNILHKLKTSIGPKIRKEQLAFRNEHLTTLHLVHFSDKLWANQPKQWRRNCGGLFRCRKGLRPRVEQRTPS